MSDNNQVPHVILNDRVKMSPMWKHHTAVGAVIKITTDYVVVKWDDIMGDWHYTYEQAKKLQVIR